MVEVPQESAPIRVATVAEIENAWESYSEKKKDMAAEHLLLSRPRTISEQKVTLMLANAVEAQLLNTLKTELLSWLREQCQDPGITVDHILEVNEAARPAYTGREKLEKLIEKYPMVKEFRERFGLDPEF
jgi:ribosomal protein L31